MNRASVKRRIERYILRTVQYCHKPLVERWAMAMRDAHKTAQLLDNGTPRNQLSQDALCAPLNAALLRDHVNHASDEHPTRANRGASIEDVEAHVMSNVPGITRPILLHLLDDMARRGIIVQQTAKLRTSGSSHKLYDEVLWDLPKSRKRVEMLSVEERAIRVLAKHPDWSNRQIAHAIGCHERTLYKKQRYQETRAAQKSMRADVPRGFKDSEGNMDAWAETQ